MINTQTKTKIVSEVERLKGELVELTSIKDEVKKWRKE